MNINEYSIAGFHRDFNCFLTRLVCSRSLCCQDVEAMCDATEFGVIVVAWSKFAQKGPHLFFTMRIKTCQLVHWQSSEFLSQGT